MSAKKARARKKIIAKKTVKKSAKKTAAPAHVDPIPPGMHSVTPHLICRGAVEAIEFYRRAFGAVEEARLLAPNGLVMHGSVRIFGSVVMLFDEMPEWGAFGPKTLKGSSVTIHLAVADVDTVFAQAVKAGAKVIMPLEDTFWGDRYGKIEDPFGHHWSIATRIKDLTPEQIAENMKTMG